MAILVAKAVCIFLFNPSESIIYLDDATSSIRGVRNCAFLISSISLIYPIMESTDPLELS